MPNQIKDTIANASFLSRNTLPPITSPFQNALLQRLLDYQPSPITQAFQTLEKNLEPNHSFDETIQQKHNAVRSVLENLGIKDTKLIGSLLRRTRIQPRPGDIFDIDILVSLGKFYGWVSSGGVSPQFALRYLHEILNKSDRYRAMNPYQIQPTITVEHKDGIKVELVPAYLDMVGYSPDGKTHTPVGRGYWVVKDGMWMLAEYDHEADYITKMNEESDDWLIPVLKMLKCIKRIYFSQMSSIHLEILSVLTIPAAVKARKTLGFQVSYPILVTDFSLYSQPLLASAVQMPGSNAAPHVLSIADQSSIQETFKIIRNYCGNINLLKSQQEKIAHWRTLFGDAFPAS